MSVNNSTSPLEDQPPADAGGVAQLDRWLLLTYRVPSEPSRARVAVWRELKRLGALYLQQAVCVVPDVAEVSSSLRAMQAKIEELGGTSFFAVLTDLDDSEQQRLVRGFAANSQKEYAEIIEECETKFFKEIEFEHFRENYTFEEAEEIRQDLEKLKRWMAKVISRDWIGVPDRAKAEEKIFECESLLDGFESEVFHRAGGEA